MTILKFYRPEILFPCFAQLISLSGIGPRTATIMEKRIGKYVIDLAFYFPISIINRCVSPDISGIIEGQIATLSLNVLSVNIPPGRQTRPAKIIAENETGKIEIVYFRAKSEYLKSLYKVGDRITISGKVDIFNHKKQITHPDYVVSFDKKDTIPELEPIYPLSAGLKQNILRKTCLSILSKIPQLPEWIDERLINSKNWPDFKTALTTSHTPESEADLDLSSKHRSRLAFDELFANQLALCLIRKQQSNTALMNPIVGDE